MEEELKTELNSISKQNDGLKTEIINSINKVDTAINQKLGAIEEILNKQNFQLNAENTKLQADNNLLIQENGKLETAIENVKKELSAEKQNNKNMQSQITKLNKDISNERDNSSKLSSDIGVLKAEVESFKSQLNTEKENLKNKNEEINKLHSDIKTKDKEIEASTVEKNDLQQQLKKLQDVYNNLNNHYKSLNIEDTLLAAFEEFTSLKEKTKASIEALFPQSSFLGFISACLRLSNISSLWEMTKRNIFNNNLDDIDKINKMFILLISIYNEGSKEKQFEIISPEIGSKYDSSTCAIKEIKSSGTVKEVLLVGYKSIKDGNIHKAIISVTD